jgi:hypothetical protein
MLAFLQKQLVAIMKRHNDGGDTVQLTLGPNIVVNALREFDYEDANPMLGGVGANKKIQLRFPNVELNGAQFKQDFDTGDRCYINGPNQLQPNGTLDPTKWELKYYRASADGLLITVGLESND